MAAKDTNPYFVVHQINPEKVAEQVTKQLDKLAAWREDKLTYWKDSEQYEKHAADAQRSYEESVAEELTYYIHVYVQRSGVREFRLKYDRSEPGGTGPFTSRKKAEDWFLNGGR
jgi:hypothetical protein